MPSTEPLKATYLAPTPSEDVWLRELLRRYQSQEAIDPWAMRIALRDALPADFSSSRVNPLLAGSNGITLLGILAVDPDSKFIADTERVILAIREMLIRDPGVRNVTAAEIADELDLDHKYTEELFALMSTVGSFWASASGTADRRGLSSINVDREECLTAFMKFRDIHAQIRQMLEDRKRIATEVSGPFHGVLGSDFTKDAGTTEILALKPSFYGISVDLKALWRKLVLLLTALRKPGGGGT